MVSNHLQISLGGFSRRGGGLGLLKLQLQDLEKRRGLERHTPLSLHCASLGALRMEGTLRHTPLCLFRCIEDGGHAAPHALRAKVASLLFHLSGHKSKYLNVIVVVIKCRL